MARPRNVLTADHHHALDRRFAVLVTGEPRTLLVMDRLTRVCVSVTAFARRFGTRGAAWIASDARPTYTDASAVPPAEGFGPPLPEKDRYQRRIGAQTIGASAQRSLVECAGVDASH